MRSLGTLAVTLFLLTISLAKAEIPKVPQNALLKPTFVMANESWSGGTAFLLRLAGGPDTFLVTCHHLFGPATGREEQMSGEDILANVCAAVGLSMQDRKTIVVADRYISFPGARKSDQMGAEKDLAVFIVRSDKPLPAFELAIDVPKIGQTVYLFARLRSEAEPRLFPATIVESEANWLCYSFKDKSILLAGASGAPILNEQGKVVGMSVAGSEQNGELIGVANPATQMEANIALRKK